MANTVWKGQLTFGLVSFPVRLLKAARKERVALKYVREVEKPPEPAELERDFQEPEDMEPSSSSLTEVAPVRQGFGADLQRGFEVAPEQFVVVRKEELRKLRPATSPDLQILRSVRMSEIDPVFLETSYYVVPNAGGEHSYRLFYRALLDTQYAALGQVAMHGREHVMIVRAASKGLIAHTMFYSSEVRAAEEYAGDSESVVGKELDLAKRFVEAIAEPFRPEEFTDRYREQLEALIASKTPVNEVASPAVVSGPGKVVDIMDALRRSLEKAGAAPARKPVGAAAPLAKERKRKASG